MSPLLTLRYSAGPQCCTALFSCTGPLAKYFTLGLENEMRQHDALPDVDTFLFGHGLTVVDYFVERTPFSEVVCFRSADGRVFDLAISNEELKKKSVRRLIELGVEVMDLRTQSGC